MVSIYNASSSCGAGIEASIAPKSI